MKKINMVDLQGQYKKIRSEVNREIKKVLKSATFINGPIVKEFELNLKVKYKGTKLSLWNGCILILCLGTLPGNCGCSFHLSIHGEGCELCTLLSLHSRSGFFKFQVGFF